MGKMLAYAMIVSTCFIYGCSFSPPASTATEPASEPTTEEPAAPTTPSILSVTGTKADDTAATLVTDAVATDINPGSMTVTFSESMDDTTFTTSNVTLAATRADGVILTPEYTLAGSGDTYTITVADSWKYALLSTTLTFTTNIKSSSGVALAADGVYTFMNGCAVSDDFNALASIPTSASDTSSCWQIGSILGTPGTWETIIDSGDVVVSPSTGSLDAALVGTNINDAIFKSITATDNFSLEINIDNAQFLGKDFAGVALSNYEGRNRAGSEDHLVIIMAGQDQGQNYCEVFAMNGDNSFISFNSIACNDLTNISIKLSKSNGAVSMQYKQGSGTYADLPHVAGDPFPDDWNDFTTLAVDFGTENAPNVSLSASIESVLTTGLTVTGQY